MPIFCLKFWITTATTNAVIMFHIYELVPMDCTTMNWHSCVIWKVKFLVLWSQTFRKKKKMIALREMVGFPFRLCWRYFTMFRFVVEISCPPTGAHFYPHPTNCQYYFLCVNGISAKLDCGHNMIYDYATQKCDLASRATCIVSVY